jgi:hypothetical protein
MIDDVIQSAITKFDCILFKSPSGRSMGIVTKHTMDFVDVIVVRRMTSELSQQYSLPPITAAEYPMAYNANMVEVIANMKDSLSVNRSFIVDIIFIVPIREVESGMFHMAGSDHVYFIRYFIDDDERLSECNTVFYFERSLVEPFSHRVFSSLNCLAQSLKRSLYNQKESDLLSKTFRLYFSMEAFMYMRSRLPNLVVSELIKNESTIAYYNTLQIETKVTMVKKIFLRVLDRTSLKELRSLLGNGIGLGLSGSRPNKRNKVKYCTLHGRLNSVEVSDTVDDQLLRNPLRKARSNGIDFIFSEQSRLLTCNVRFTSLIVSSEDVARSRIPSVFVEHPATSVYVGAWFLYNGIVQQVVQISGNVVSCKEPDEDDEVLFQLPVATVSHLIDIFGR